MKLLFTFLFLAVFFYGYSQVNKYGIPNITNYVPSEYQASEQNWAIAQDERGVLYVGNDERGILEYDGIRWRQIKIENNSAVRSLTVNSTGNIFFGAVGEIGFLTPDPNGKLSASSLNYLIDSTSQKFADVWKTFILHDQINFCTSNKIFEFKNHSLNILSLPKNAFFSFNVDNKIFTGDFIKGLYQKTGDTFLEVKNGHFFSNKGIYTIDKIDDSTLLIGTYPNGLFCYSHNGVISDSYKNMESNKFLIENQLYNSNRLTGNLIAFGTINKGLMVMDIHGEMEGVLNKSNGLQDETVTNLYKSDELIWTSLYSGVSKVEYNYPIRKFDYITGLQGSVCDITSFNNHLYVATSLGIYKLTTDKDNFAQFQNVGGITDMVWSLVIDKSSEQLLAGSISGLYSISMNGKSTYIDPAIRSESEPNLKNYITKIYHSKHIENEFYIGKINAFFSIKNTHRQWQRASSFSKIKDEVIGIYVCNDTSIWLSTNYNGVIHIDIKEKDTVYNSYNTNSGLPTLNDVFISEVNEKLIFGTEKGFYHFDENTKRFNPDSIFGSEFCNGAIGIFRFNQAPDGYYWFSLFNDKRKWIERGYFDSTGVFIRDSLPFKRLPNEQFDAIYHDSDGITWLGSSSGLYSYNPNVKVDYYKTYHTLVRKVTTVNDSVLFWGTNYTTDSAGNRTVALEQPTGLIPVLNYQFNDLTFEFAAPYFVEEKMTEYSFILHGYKDTWSKWNTEPKSVYTNLREGKYAFQVKARNIYGIESTTATYEFTILPPWYRTVWAYLIYTLLGIGFVVMVVKLYTRKLRLEKIKLEGIVLERTAEIRRQKEDIEQKNEILKEQKEEIETQADKLKEANEVLTEQKEEITHQKEEITSSIVYAKRIQRAVVPSEELAQCLLKDYFLLWRPRDIVSGDFWWLTEQNESVIVAAADCTGHGVPGAFMSMLGVSFLNEIVKQQHIVQSHEILNRLRNKVKTTLGQTGKEGEAKDGMDIALMVIDFKNMNLQFSGAYNPLYLFRNGELEVIKADRNPIGIYIKEKESFTQNILPLQKGDTLYIFSDGYIDQFGGPDRMKLTSTRFKEILESIQHLPMSEQREYLNTAIDNWRGSTEQIDDIIVLGIRL